jgi:ethanolamine utilization protein EutK
MSQLAQGFVEAAGLVAAIEVSDTMAKTADVKIIAAHKVDGLRICVVCEGDVAACKAAVNAGVSKAVSMNALLGSNIIPRPDGGAGALKKELDSVNRRKAERKAAKAALRAGKSTTEQAVTSKTTPKPPADSSAVKSLSVKI